MRLETVIAISLSISIRMPSIWTIATIALIGATVLAALVRYFHEQQYFARYEWKKQKIEELRAEMEAAASEEGRSTD